MSEEGVTFQITQLPLLSWPRLMVLAIQHLEGGILSRTTGDRATWIHDPLDRRRWLKRVFCGVHGRALSGAAII